MHTTRRERRERRRGRRGKKDPAHRHKMLSHSVFHSTLGRWTDREHIFDFAPNPGTRDCPTPTRPPKREQTGPTTFELTFVRREGRGGTRPFSCPSCPHGGCPIGKSPTVEEFHGPTPLVAYPCLLKARHLSGHGHEYTHECRASGCHLASSSLPGHATFEEERKEMRGSSTTARSRFIFSFVVFVV